MIIIMMMNVKFLNNINNINKILIKDRIINY